MRAEIPTNPICLAIDTTDRSLIENLVEQTRDSVGMFKLGLTAMYGMGTGVIHEIAWDRPLFLDAKLHDIPAQVGSAAAALGSLGASFVTVHAGGGVDMVRAAVEGAGDTSVLAVTILTSLAQSDLDEMGFQAKTSDVVRRLADLAMVGGARGLVCSAHEVADLRNHFGPRDAGGPILVVPGIRPSSADKQDQQRTMAPREALERGADILVIGRPITGAADVAAAAQRVKEDLAA